MNFYTIRKMNIEKLGELVAIKKEAIANDKTLSVYHEDIKKVVDNLCSYMVDFDNGNIIISISDAKQKINSLLEYYRVEVAEYNTNLTDKG